MQTNLKYAYYFNFISQFQYKQSKQDFNHAQEEKEKN